MDEWKHEKEAEAKPEEIVNISETSYTVPDLSDLKLLKIASSLAKVQIPDEV